ncbi:MAG: metal-dependent hydrolase [Deltaproteobacteria bacterium]|nr:metal-dependent hydrolase [Deltaproteobacteria bacterium]
MQIRNLRFLFDVPRYWHPAGRAVTIYTNNLSIFFPAGERFFIASVKAHERFVTDAGLKEDVRGFCGQEAIHRREHEAYNRMLAAQGYPVAELERGVERILALVTRVLPKRWQLAATVALEHFTASMGHGLLADARILAGAHPEMAALWRWHAIEENEHKAVAFDVFRAAGGTRFERSFIMLGATIIFWLKVIEQQWRMMHADGIAWDLAEWKQLARFLFVTPGPMRELFSLYLPYFRRDFHPWDFDNRALVARAAAATWEAA